METIWALEGLPPFGQAPCERYHRRLGRDLGLGVGALGSCRVLKTRGFGARVLANTVSNVMPNVKVQVF